jgi:hypothetical protein
MQHPLDGSSERNGVGNVSRIGIDGEWGGSV